MRVYKTCAAFLAVTRIPNIATPYLTVIKRSDESIEKVYLRSTFGVELWQASLLFWNSQRQVSGELDESGMLQ